MGRAERFKGLGKVLLPLGVVVLVVGFRLEIQNPRSDAEDDVALTVLAAGASLIAAGYFLATDQPEWAIPAALCAPSIGYVLMVALVWSCILLTCAVKALQHALFG